MVFAVKVYSAGIKHINDIYYPTEHFHGNSQVYSKTGDFHDRKDYDFLLWLFHDYWFLSTLKRGEVLENYGNKYYYCCNNRHAGAVDDITHNLKSCANINSIPSSNGWTVDVHGCLPAPHITILQRKINTSSSLCSDNSDSDDTSNNTTRSSMNDDDSIMERILFQEQWSDVHFHCPDSCKVLHAHKVILCASCPYFAKIFSEDDTLSSDGTNGKGGVWITSYPYRVMELLLTFVYTGTTRDTDDDTILKYPLEVLSMAHEYQLPPVLMKRIEKALIQSIDKYNVKNLLQTSSQHNLYTLKESCFEFIQKNIMINVFDR